MPDFADPALRARILSGGALAVVALAALVAGSWTFAAVVAAAALALAWEWGRLTRLRWSDRVGTAAAAVTAVAAVGALLLVMTGRDVAALGLLAFAAVTAGLAAALMRWAGAIWLAAGVLYIGIPVAALAWLRGHGGDGLIAVLWLLGVVWTTDIAAYFVGRAIGGPRLAPSISPGKTWAGFWGGLAGAVLVGVMIGVAFGAQELIRPALLAAVLSLLAQMGDLAESALKRRVGLKDASGLIPGHGGALDRVDGLMFAAPALALYIQLSGERALPWH